MSKALELATRYFINELKPDTLKLQKLLYFTQGISYCMIDDEFFPEQFEAWVHGPVVPTVYHHYKKHGFNPIDIDYVIDDMTQTQREILEYVRDAYGQYDGRYLEEMTHKQEPWLWARQGLDPDEHDDKIIPKSIIADYFIGLMFQPRLEAWA